MNHALLQGLAGLTALALIGRIGLSLLPPGWPGGHEPRELAVTWAASHVAGLALLSVHAACLRALELAPGPIANLAPWAAVAVVRVALLPGAMRPRHEPPRAPLGWLGPCAMGIAALALAVATLRALSPGGAPPEGAAASIGALLGPRVGTPLAALLAPATLAAAAVLVAGGLERTRRAPLARALALLAVAAAALAHPRSEGPTLTLSLYAAGASAAVAWLRRGDRRGAALGAGGLAACALSGPAGWPLAAAGLAVLAAVTPGPGRGRVLAFAAPMGLALLGAGLVLGPAAARAPGVPASLATATLPAVLAAAPLLLAWARSFRMRRYPGPAERLEGAPEPDRELLASALWLSGALLASIPPLSRPPDLLPRFLELAPLAVLFTGLLLAPAERVRRDA